MITVPLRIRYGAAPTREAAAWFIPGAAPQRWLEELLAWQVPLPSLTLYVVPHSAADLRPRGVLVIAPAGRPASASGRCQAYGRWGDRLYLPVEARLEPELSGAELQALLPIGGEVFLFHPLAGLIGFERGDARAVHDLLQLPPSQATAWDRAQPGVAFSRRLTSIEPEATPTAEDVFAAGQDGIGSQADDLEKEMERLPLSPEEPSRSLSGRMGRGISRAVAQAIRRLAGGEQAAGSTGRQPGRLARWAQRQLSRLDEQLNRLRNRTLLRLMRLLEHDPDKGLQYAIPFGDCGHRGLAPPSANLARHGVEFDLGLLSHGGPADRWDISAEMFRRLRDLYFQLANRELRLGRHRRAAYIFGMLLGMFDQAAAALVAGRHWREAAVLYRTRLHRPDEAARCLEQGRLWSEAIALYEDLGEFEKAGDLLAGLDQPDEAARCYRQAVLRHQLAEDFLSAARVLETKLAVPDEALQRLEEGWPNSPQAAKCLEESFRLLARLGRHERVLERIGQLRQSAASGWLAVTLADSFAALATTYPNQAVRPVAADAVRTIAAGRLREASSGEQRQLIGAVRRLAPEDRLLDRDCQRYLRAGRTVVPPAPVAATRRGPSGGQSRRLVPVKEFSLFPGIETLWQSAASVGDRFFAAGYRPHAGKWMVVAAECLWDGTHRWLVSPQAWTMPDADRPILLAADPRASGDVLLHVTGRPLRVLNVPAAPPFPCSVRLGSPTWLPASALAVSATPTGRVWTATRDRHIVVVDTFSSAGQLLSSRPIEEPFDPADPAAEHGTVLCVLRELTVVGGGRSLVVLRPTGDTKTIGLDDEVLHLAASTSPLPRNIAVALRHSVVAFRTDGVITGILFAREFDAPVVGFLPAGGWLVAVDAVRGQVWRLHDDEADLAAEFTCDGQRPLAVLPTSHLREFALLLENGVVRRYEIKP